MSRGMKAFIVLKKAGMARRARKAGKAEGKIRRWEAKKIRGCDKK